MLLQLPGLFCDLSNMFVTHSTRAAHRLAGLVLVLPLPLVHLLLIGTWWGALRWISVPLPAAAGVTIAWLLCLALGIQCLK